MMPQRKSRLAQRLAPPAFVVALSGALFAYLLARFPYNGFYGQDSYAYFYQAEALWRELTGQPQPPFALFSANGLYWPIGYHLHLLPGFLTGWPEAGRALTLAMAALTPAILYLVVGEVWYTAGTGERALAGVVAGVVLLVNGTYVRTGLSLMSDVPAVFWGTLSVYCCLRAWPPGESIYGGRANHVWALGAGLSLGLAVLVRYSSTLLVPAMVLYVLARLYARKRQGLTQEAGQPGARWQIEVLLAVVCVLAALLPQVAYALTHEPGPALRGWSIGNLFSSTVSGSDGTETFSQPMIVFYLLGPLASAGAGFLSPLYLGAFAFGIWMLVRERNLSISVLLFLWWFIGVLAYSGTNYQAHRFVLTFMPVLAMLVGIGASSATLLLLRKLVRARGGRGIREVGLAVTATLILLGLFIGLVQGWHSAERWTATHSAFNTHEQQVVALASQAVATQEEGTPKAVSFGFSAPLYHYTRWPILDFFLHDEEDIRDFLAGPGPRIAVLPEESMSTRWAGTPSGTRWQWIQNTYELTMQGTVGVFTVYRVADR
ncbi:MAG: phospholipid carrier-dependent glycosyltransferase [Chloroflexota bacterium]|nr:phospholipid carrier-dependent glycosyltransferase [Chloroflexota bacterium]MDQ5866624.1 phospholipid carrier-dependent glycosyltransferase [Chloroflexota bacterium]